jgi:hypothetical protein
MEILLKMPPKQNLKIFIKIKFLNHYNLQQITNLEKGKVLQN